MAEAESHQAQLQIQAKNILDRACVVHVFFKDLVTDFMTIHFGR
jgi:hypothetical protein